MCSESTRREFLKMSTAGLAAGAGFEYGITPNLSTKLEYMWVGAASLNSLRENMVRAGVNWRFGG